jgi:raffinose/stachyose/melibiose transport system permease protein
MAAVVTEPAAAPGTRATPPSARRRRDPLQPVAYAVALAVAGVVLAPLAYVVIGGFRTTGDLAANPVGLPHPWEWRNYTDTLTSGTFWRLVLNSTLIAVTATAITVAFGAMAAYALSRIAFRGREAVFGLFAAGLLFPVSVAVLPLYVLLRVLNLLDGPIGVALPEAAFGLPMTIVILRPFMRAVPGELEDSAVIDGCSRFGFFWRILLPLCRPALLTVGVLAFVASWNAYLLPLLVISDENQQTLPLGVAQFATVYTADTARILAFTALSMLPALLMFTLAERRIVGGLSGAVKG